MEYTLQRAVSITSIPSQVKIQQSVKIIIFIRLQPVKENYYKFPSRLSDVSA